MLVGINLVLEEIGVARDVEHRIEIRRHVLPIGRGSIFTAGQAATPKVGQPLNPKMAEPNSTIRVVIAPELDEFDGQTVPLSSCTPRTDVRATASIPSA